MSLSRSAGRVCIGLLTSPAFFRGFDSHHIPFPLEIVAEYYDAAVSGADAIDTRAGFAAMLKRIEGNGVRTIIVETSSRFARDLMVQEVGHAMLRGRGIDLIAADSPGSFLMTRLLPSLCARCSAPSASLTRQ